MEDLNKWMDILTEALGKVGYSLTVLDDMKQKSIIQILTVVEEYVRSFKEDAAPDGDGKDEESNREIKIPLREGVLQTNLGLPILIVVTKVKIS